MSEPFFCAWRYEREIDHTTACQLHSYEKNLQHHYTKTNVQYRETSCSNFLRRRDCFALWRFGSWKTTFTQGLAAGLGIKQVITSPTFVILKNYAVFEHTQGITQLVHIDTYRIKNEKELEGIGALDFLRNLILYVSLNGQKTGHVT